MILLCQLNSPFHYLWHNVEQFPMMFDQLPSKLSQFLLTWFVRVVTLVSICSIIVLGFGLQFISIQFEVVRPRGLCWIQDFAACGLERAIRTSAITKPTRVEKVRILVFLGQVLRLRNKVFNPSESGAFGAPSTNKVRFMQQAKGTCEPEVPPQAGAKFQIALASINLAWTMSALNRRRRRFRLRRKDLHLGKTTLASVSKGLGGFPRGQTNCRGIVSGSHLLRPPAAYAIA